ncbi:YmfQ family protein [Clostridium aminobutyricum]|uniref:YmfQ family protein n=1 Tax=Clostridium aminobutyricum TaxID=33953 RepID=A0A939D8L1_CLOAM|nr:YmfQ family protein [Clostridium aminobutyricum]MBN7773161.1 YmfQ family protein [Clostridium aminobutyricum]
MLLDYMPSYYKDSKVFAALLKAFTDEINANNYAISDLESQFFVDTATWGLSVWEKELNITTDISKAYQERRELIKSKMRGTGTCTIEMIKNTALAYTNAEIEVIEDNPNYKFVVRFIGVKGIPDYIETFKHTIDTIKPAHLSYRVEYNYNTWGEVKEVTWGTIKTGTWGELKTRILENPYTRWQDANAMTWDQVEAKTWDELNTRKVI